MAPLGGMKAKNVLMRRVSQRSKKHLYRGVTTLVLSAQVFCLCLSVHICIRKLHFNFGC
jgi:hypothetical protein